MAYRSSSPIRRALAGVFLFASLALSGATYAQQAATAAPSPSVEETVAYINAHAFEQGAPGAARVAVSNDGEQLVVSFRNPDPDIALQVDVAPIRNLDNPDNSDGVVEVQCKGHLPCVTRTRYDAQGNPLPSHEKSQNPKMVKFLRAGYIPDDPEKARRVINAVQHLLDLLNSQYQARHPEPPDPFK